jgi:oligopeptide/dipeptide ABC transporter ATP-binding protein
MKEGVLRKVKGCVKALDRVSLDIYRGETLGLVGESGCGKSTLGKLILRLEEPTDGTIWFKGKNISECNKQSMRSFRREMQMIFQDPYSSLDFRKTAGYSIEEPFLVHEKLLTKHERKQKVLRLMDEVGLLREHFDRYPHEFSGGQRQRIGIARAIALNPELVICDEPVSALDVSIQAQVINLLKDLQEKHSLTYLFISHDLALVKHISDRITVMYLGQIVETAARETIYTRPFHPYTQALISASPLPTTKVRKDRIILAGDVPSSIDPPSGCYFHPRCPRSKGLCKNEKPGLREVESNHFVRCFLYS